MQRKQTIRPWQYVEHLIWADAHRLAFLLANSVDFVSEEMSSQHKCDTPVQFYAPAILLSSLLEGIDMPNPRSLSFPIIKRIILNGFSLYNLEPNIDIEIPSGVFCLAGANGLGKSTFLSAVNFCISGFVPHSKDGYLSSNAFYKHNRYESSYTEDYFTGRIDEKNREVAHITLEMTIGNVPFVITRGVFTPKGLLEFVVEGVGDYSLSHEMGDDPLEIEGSFNKWIASQIGVDKFEQYVFLLYYVMTFDESRHLLMWDPKALSDALYLAIGGDPKRALEAAKLRREMGRADSNARNTGYHASNVRQRINTIIDEFGVEQEKTMNSESTLAPEEVQRQHEEIDAKVESQRKKIERKWSELRDAELLWARTSSRLSALHEDYTREFSLHVHKRTRVDLHPTVAASISENQCAVCGADGVASAIEARINNGSCPLCDNDLPKKPPPTSSIRRLQKIDADITSAKDALSESAAAKERIKLEVQAAEDGLEALKEELREFEEENKRALFLATSGGEESISQTLARLNAEMKELHTQKVEHYKIRDKKRRELVSLQREVQKKYAVAEGEFVPLLANLAKSFLGIDLHIKLVASEAISTLGLSLVFEMRGTSRREKYQLSESQGFFLDIALRMAFSQYMSSSGNEASLFIDTPEGSLDIAYEARAGIMFAEFVDSNHSIIMTANINSSQLLQRLAQKCGRQNMSLHRMTNWTELSDVQLEEEDLFRGAIGQIETALGG